MSASACLTVMIGSETYTAYVIERPDMQLTAICEGEGSHAIQVHNTRTLALKSWRALAVFSPLILAVITIAGITVQILALSTLILTFYFEKIHKNLNSHVFDE